MKKNTLISMCSTAILLLAGFTTNPAIAEGLYKWVDKYGNVTYQSSPPPADARTVEKPEIRTGGDAISEAEQQPDGEKAVEKNEQPIVFYSRSKEECASCDKVREYFEANEIPFDEVNMTDDEEQAAELEKRIGYNSAPTFAIGEIVVSGFDEKMLTNILIKQGYAFPPKEE